MNLQPVEDRIVVRPGEQEAPTASRIVIPATAKEKPQQGDVLAVGPGRRPEQSGEPPPPHTTPGAPTITNDGVTIAKEVELEDPFENMGAQLVKEVATKTNDVAGDGTTTATVLAQALVHEGLRNVTAGANPLALKKGIDKAVAAVVKAIESQAKEVDDKSEIAQVAAISAADQAIGDVISDAIDKVGKDGVVTVEESQTFGMELEFTEGMQFDKGFLSPHFVTDPERQESVLEDVYVLLANQKIGAVHDLLPVLEKVIQAGKPLLMVA